MLMVIPEALINAFLAKFRSQLLFKLISLHEELNAKWFANKFSFFFVEEFFLYEFSSSPLLLVPPQFINLELWNSLNYYVFG